MRKNGRLRRGSRWPRTWQRNRFILARPREWLVPRCSRGDHKDVDSLRGHLLLAGAGLYDPNFRRTVILVGEHVDEGAMGVVLNRPSPIPVEEAVPPLAELPGLAGGDGLVYVGGPVQPDAIVV